MDCTKQFELWKQQVLKLRNSVTSLSETNPGNVLQHFFLQASQTELEKELETFKNIIKNLINEAIKRAPDLTGTPRQRSVSIIKHFITEPILSDITLADIRNIAVFEIYKQCGITVDTYFDRYSSPPGNANQNEQYNNIAHGRARASAETTKNLTKMLVSMQILKRFFIVYDFVFDNNSSTPNSDALNWLGAMWASHVQQNGLSDLIWELFLDLWHYEN
jgi:hypothetical protein